MDFANQQPASGPAPPNAPPALLPAGGIPPERIGFDIDGVVADTASAFLRIARREYGLHLDLEAIDRYDVEECVPHGRHQVTAIFQRLLEDPLGEGLQPMPDAIPTLERLADAAPLTFITARPQRAPIDRWLHAMLSPAAYRNMTLVATGEHDNKAPYIHRHGLTHFVDDRAETCLGLATEEITPIVFSQPWNRGRHELAQVENWADIQRLCLAGT